jgi:hypothetical protein
MTRWLLVSIATIVLAACGGDGMAPPPTAGPTPTRAPVSAQDTSYAVVVCNAFGKYLSAFSAEQQKDPMLFSDQAKLLRVAAPILETLGKDMDRAKPPKDMANFHDAIVARVKAMAAKARSNAVVSTAELADFTKDAPLPPDTVRERMAEAANARPECATTGGMDALFGDTGR